MLLNIKLKKKKSYREAPSRDLETQNIFQKYIHFYNLHVKKKVKKIEKKREVCMWCDPSWESIFFLEISIIHIGV